MQKQQNQNKTRKNAELNEMPAKHTIKSSMRGKETDNSINRQRQKAAENEC